MKIQEKIYAYRYVISYECPGCGASIKEEKDNFVLSVQELPKLKRAIEFCKFCQAKRRLRILKADIECVEFVESDSERKLIPCKNTGG